MPSTFPDSLLYFQISVGGASDTIDLRPFIMHGLRGRKSKTDLRNQQFDRNGGVLGSKRVGQTPETLPSLGWYGSRMLEIGQRHGSLPVKRDPISTRSVRECIGDMAADNGWSSFSKAINCLPVVHNIQQYSRYVDLTAGTQESAGYLNPNLDLVEMRYGSVADTMGSNNCLYLILKYHHDGDSDPIPFKPATQAFVVVLLMDDKGSHEKLTPGKGDLGILVAKATKDRVTRFAIAIGISSMEWPEYRSKYCGELKEDRSICVSLQEFGRSHDYRFHGAWRSGPPIVDDPNAPGCAFSTS